MHITLEKIAESIRLKTFNANDAMEIIDEALAKPDLLETIKQAYEMGIGRDCHIILRETLEAYGIVVNQKGQINE